MPKLTYGHVMSADVKIHYYRIQDEKPPLVLLHGFSDNGLCWNRVALALEPYFDVTMIDARGHGLSDAPNEGYGPLEHAADTAAVITGLKLNKPTLVGHSMGASSALFTAALNPKLVGAICLVDPPFWKTLDEDTEEARTQRTTHFNDWLVDLKHKSLDEIIASARKQYPTWDESEFFQWAKAKQQVSPNTLSGIQKPRPHWREYAARVTCPVQLFTADPQKGGLVKPEVSQEMSLLWKKFEHVDFPDAGHNLHRDQPRKFIEALKKFLFEYNAR